MSKADRNQLSKRHDKKAAERQWARDAHRHAHPELYPDKYDQLNEFLSSI